MTGIADALGAIDDLGVWLAGELDGLPADSRALVVTPAVVLVICLIPRIVVRRLLPWAGEYVLLPAAMLATGVVTAAVLAVDFVLARAFRLLWLPLTPGHYALGDWTISGARGARAAAGTWTHQAGRWLSRFSPVVLLFAGIAITILWNAGYCTRNPGPSCATPLAQWWHDIWAAWLSLIG
jgi:hypothetical protein